MVRDGWLLEESKFSAVRRLWGADSILQMDVFAFSLLSQQGWEQRNNVEASIAHFYSCIHICLFWILQLEYLHTAQELQKNLLVFKPSLSHIVVLDKRRTSFFLSFCSGVLRGCMTSVWLEIRRFFVSCILIAFYSKAFSLVPMQLWVNTHTPTRAPLYTTL